jgi:hypothetical protein
MAIILGAWGLHVEALPKRRKLVEVQSSVWLTNRPLRLDSDREGKRRFRLHCGGIGTNLHLELTTGFTKRNIHRPANGGDVVLLIEWIIRAKDRPEAQEEECQDGS